MLLRFSIALLNAFTTISKICLVGFGIDSVYSSEYSTKYILSSRLAILVRRNSRETLVANAKRDKSTPVRMSYPSADPSYLCNEHRVPGSAPTA